MTEENRNCVNHGCKKEATKTLHLTFYDAPGNSAEAYVSVNFCDEHVLNDEKVAEFLSLNWAHIAFGFESSGFSEPVREKTAWQWAPIEEALEFWKRQVNTRVVRKQ